MNKTALITGASGGIGLELAKVIAANGHNLLLVARNEQRLQEVSYSLQEKYKVEVKIIAMDLSQPDSAAQLHTKLQKENIKVDILVNNAGFATYGLFTETELQAQMEMLRLNILTLTQLTYLLSKDMIAQGGGKIMNVASTASFQPGPLMAVYYASKAYVLSFSEAIHEELKDKGITVTALCPGPTATGFQQRAKMEGVFLLRMMRPMSAEKVAKVGYDALMKGKTVCIPGFTNKAMASLIPFSPRRLVTKVVRKIQER